MSTFRPEQLRQPLSLSGSFTGSFTGSINGTISTASYYKETDPIFTAKSASLATTGSNTFNGTQTITGSINQSGGDINIIGDTFLYFVGNNSNIITIANEGSEPYIQLRNDNLTGSIQISPNVIFKRIDQGNNITFLNFTTHSLGDVNLYFPSSSGILTTAVNGTGSDDGGNITLTTIPTASYVNPLNQNVNITGSVNIANGSNYFNVYGNNGLIASLGNDGGDPSFTLTPADQTGSLNITPLGFDRTFDIDSNYRTYVDFKYAENDSVNLFFPSSNGILATKVNGTGSDDGGNITLTTIPTASHVNPLLQDIEVTGSLSITGSLILNSVNQEPTVVDEIDCSLSSYDITSWGVYRITVADGTNTYSINLPDPTRFPGKEITIINSDGNHTNPYGGSYPAYKADGGGLYSIISNDRIMIFKSIGGKWIGGYLTLS